MFNIFALMPRNHLILFDLAIWINKQQSNSIQTVSMNDSRYWPNYFVIKLFVLETGLKLKLFVKLSDSECMFARLGVAGAALQTAL